MKSYGVAALFVVTL